MTLTKNSESLHVSQNLHIILIHGNVTYAEATSNYSKLRKCHNFVKNDKKRPDIRWD